MAQGYRLHYLCSVRYVMSENINANALPAPGALALKDHTTNRAIRITRRLAASAFLAILCIGSNVNAADHTCTDCHNSAIPNANDLIKPLSTLCADCHAERIAAGEHVVDVSVLSSTNTLPLHNGTMTCATCHDPHQPRAALRMVDPELCRQCHPR